MSRTRHTITESHESFICQHCGSLVPPATTGGRNRNHCPACLYGAHRDIIAGDRRSPCKGLMKPIAIQARDDGEWNVVHRCERCGVIRANRIAADDDERELLKLALLPITRLPFPLGA